MTNEKDASPVVDELRQLWARGSKPSGLLRHLTSKGLEGATVIIAMMDAFGLTAGNASAISGWLSDGDDERLDLLLSRRMPERPGVGNSA